MKPGDKVRIVMPRRTGTVLKVEAGVVKVEEPDGGKLWWLKKYLEPDNFMRRVVEWLKNLFKESENY